MPDFSVIIPTWNRRQQLLHCLASIRSADYDQDLVEVLVCDDGSDPEEKPAEWELAKFSVRYLEPAGHAGPNAARNAGLSRATADVYAFLDDDLEIPADWFRAATNVLARHPDALAVGGPVGVKLMVDPARICVREELFETIIDNGPDPIATVMIGGGNMVVRKEAFERFGRFDASLALYGDETAWLDRLHRERPGLVMYDPELGARQVRLADDLRPARIARRVYRRGRGSYGNMVRGGQPASAREHVSIAARSLGHAGQKRCLGGVYSALHHLGAAVGIAGARLTGGPASVHLRGSGVGS